MPEVPITIPVYQPYLGKEERTRLIECIDDNWITAGKKVQEFEERIAKLQGAKYAVACCNGTIALYMGLLAMGIKPRDEVIVPDFTFIASANAVKWARAIPVLCDVDVKTMNLDANECEELITSKTKAIEPVHIYGQSCNMALMNDLCEDMDLMMIEDAAQAIGVSFRKQMAGSFGTVSCFSFYGDKTITTGEGGMCLTSDDKVYENMLTLKHQGRLKMGGWYVHPKMGYNFRMSDLTAAVGLAQLDKLEFIIKRKKEIEVLYRRELGKVKEVALPYIDHRGVNVPFRINIMVQNPLALHEYLKAKGIGSMRFFVPLHTQPCYADTPDAKREFPVSDWLYKHGLSLPSYVALTDEQVLKVCQEIKNFYQENPGDGIPSFGA